MVIKIKSKKVFIVVNCWNILLRNSYNGSKDNPLSLLTTGRRHCNATVVCVQEVQWRVDVVFQDNLVISSKVGVRRDL